MSERLLLRVPSVDCQGWVATIRLAVSQVEGVTNIEGDPGKQTIAIDYDPATVEPEAIRTALEEIGHESTVID